MELRRQDCEKRRLPAPTGLVLLLCLGLIGTGAAQQGTTIRTSALAFLKTLATPAREKAVQAFGSADRDNWGYTPRSRKGLPVGEMTPQQHAAMNAVLRNTLSPQGLAKTNGVIELEPILGALEGNSRRDPDRYYFSIFGDPAESRGAGGWRVIISRSTSPSSKSGSHQLRHSLARIRRGFRLEFGRTGGCWPKKKTWHDAWSRPCQRISVNAP